MLNVNQILKLQWSRQKEEEKADDVRSATEFEHCSSSSERGQPFLRYNNHGTHVDSVLEAADIAVTDRRIVSCLGTHTGNTIQHHSLFLCSENEGSASSRVNIHQKLQEKKQKQLAELKIIEEEIKQGKLGGPNSINHLRLDEDGQTTLPRQPIPCVKKHINIDPHEWRTSSPDPSMMFNNINAIAPPNVHDIDKFACAYIDDQDDSVLGVDPNGYRIPSDIDSQVI